MLLQSRARGNALRSCVAVWLCVLLPALTPSTAALGGARHLAVGVLNSTCLEDLAANISRCYDQAPVQANVHVAIPVIRTNIIRPILGCSDTTGAPVNVMQLQGPNTNYANQVAIAAKLVLGPLYMVVNVTFVALTSWAMAPLLDVQRAIARADGSYGSDAWFLNPQVAGSMADLGALQDLSGVVQDDAPLNWTDIHPFYRGANANYGGKVLMLPVSGAMWMMYVRRDVLAARGLSVPVTWEQLIQVAAAVNGTDMNKDGVKDAAICFAPCISFMISSIWASIVQIEGVQQGLLYDVKTMQVMANTTAFAEALRLKSCTLTRPHFRFLLLS